MIPICKNSKFGVFSFSLSIISSILLILAISFLISFYKGAYDENGYTNTGVIIGFISTIHILFLAGIGVLISIFAGVAAIFQKKVSKKFAYWGLTIDFLVILVGFILILTDT